MNKSHIIFPDKIERHHNSAMLNVEQEKYYNLVWYARSDSNADVAKKERKQIEKLYPEETEQLINENGKWQHGFNSGMLACLRLINGGKGMTHESIADFPSLDS
tara:strand:+ start:275 stop:586 length:312 start_codon:yes stop_codon:yes gene_type:complete